MLSSTLTMWGQIKRKTHPCHTQLEDAMDDPQLHGMADGLGDVYSEDAYADHPQQSPHEEHAGCHEES